MKAHIVLAHPEPQSFNANLARVAAETLTSQGWSVTTSDLYAMGFDPCERGDHYAPRKNDARFDAQAEQHHASASSAIPAAVAAEIARLDQADLLILQYPMWWHLPPAMLKGWIDRVFIYGEVYQSKKRFENGRFTASAPCCRSPSARVPRPMPMTGAAATSTCFVASQFLARLCRL